MSELLQCPTCKGKGHVFDSPAALFGGLIAWLIALSDRNDHNGVTREKCGQCKGEGFI